MTVFSEVICYVLILIGFKVRFSVVPLIVTMLVAIFVVNLKDPWASKEMAALYLTGYIALVFCAAGNIAIDKLIFKKK